MKSRPPSAGWRRICLEIDGRGPVSDTIFVERLWRAVKNEEVYLKDYENVAFGVASLGAYCGFYNHERLHQALGFRTPVSIYGSAR
jgi:putative transposase